MAFFLSINKGRHQSRHSLRLQFPQFAKKLPHTVGVEFATTPSFFCDRGEEAEFSRVTTLILVLDGPERYSSKTSCTLLVY